MPLKSLHRAKSNEFTFQTTSTSTEGGNTLTATRSDLEGKTNTTSSIEEESTATTTPVEQERSNRLTANTSTPTAGDRSLTTKDNEFTSATTSLQGNQGNTLIGTVSDLGGLVKELGGKETDNQIIIDLPSDIGT